MSNLERDAVSHTTTLPPGCRASPPVRFVPLLVCVACPLLWPKVGLLLTTFESDLQLRFCFGSVGASCSQYDGGFHDEARKERGSAATPILEICFDPPPPKKKNLVLEVLE